MTNTMDFSITEDQVKEILDGVQTRMIERITSSIDYDVSAKAREHVGQAIVQWLDENVVPDVLKAMEDGKQPIIEAAIESSKVIAPLLCEKIVNTAKENLESYRCNDVIKKLFGGY